jgi:hypothetical protein
MAAFFLLIAVIIGVVVGDATLANTGSGTVTLFNRWTITRFTEGELLLIAALLGFLCALFLFTAFGASKSRRMRRRERRVARHDLEGRIAELEQDNAGLRQELGRAESPDRFNAPREAPEPGVPVGSRADAAPPPGPRADEF